MNDTATQAPCTPPVDTDPPSPLQLQHAAVRLPAATLGGSCGNVDADRSSTAARKAALVCIADHAGAGWWALKIATIAAETGHGERTCRRALDWLARTGWIGRDRTRHDDGSQGVYWWRVDAARIVAAARPVTMAAPSGHDDRGGPVTVAARKGDRLSGGPFQEENPPERARPRDAVTVEDLDRRDGGGEDPSPRSETVDDPDGQPDELQDFAAAVVAVLEDGPFAGVDPAELTRRSRAPLADLARRGLSPALVAAEVATIMPAPPDPVRHPTGLVASRLDKVAADPAAGTRPTSPARSRRWTGGELATRYAAMAETLRGGRPQPPPAPGPADPAAWTRCPTDVAEQARRQLGALPSGRRDTLDVPDTEPS